MRVIILVVLLYSQNNQGTGMYQVALAFSVWVAFRVSGIAGQQYSDNVIVKLAATGFGPGAWFFNYS